MLVGPVPGLGQSGRHLLAETLFEPQEIEVVHHLHHAVELFFRHDVAIGLVSFEVPFLAIPGLVQRAQLFRLHPSQVGHVGPVGCGLLEGAQVLRYDVCHRRIIVYVTRRPRTVPHEAGGMGKEIPRSGDYY